MYWRRQQVEDLALITLLDFRRRTGRPLTPPIDVELVGEIACGLHWDWEPLPEPPQTHVWAALYPSEQRVVLNETHRALFEAKPGLERFTRAHEIGHWMLHVEGGRWGVEEAGGSESEPAERPLRPFADSSPRPVRAPVPPLLTSATGPRPWIERHADWFAASLLMPASLFVPSAEEEAGRGDLSDWRAQSRLARKFGVTLSALRVRLSDLGFLATA